MPSVPTYDTPQVKPEALPGARADSVATPDFLAGPSRERERQAKVVTGAALDVYGAMQERENADSVFRAETAAKDAYLQYEQDVRKSRQGRFAKGLTGDTAKWWDEQTQKQGESLGNPMQQSLFQKRMAALRQSSMDGVAQWEATQLERSHDEGWLADKNATISLAAASADQQPYTAPDGREVNPVESARGEIQRLNRYQAGRKGWEPAKLEAENRKDLTALHKQVIQQLAVKDPISAAAYFEKYKDEIDGTQQAELGKFAKDTSANAIGEKTAEAIWSQHGPKGDSEPGELDKLEAKARAALKDNDVALKAALAGLKERTVARDKGVKDREYGNAAAVASADLAGKSITEIRAMPEFLALPGTKQQAMLEHMESVRYTRSERDRQAQARAEDDRAKKNDAAYFAYSDPAALKLMTRNEVAALLPELGRVYTANLLTKWDSLSKDEVKYTEAKLDINDFNHVAEGAGLKPFYPKKDEEARAALGELKYRIENRLDQEQEKAKRKLTRGEKIQIMQQEMDNKVMVSRFILTDPSKPAILLSPDEMKNAYVMVGEQRVNLSSIPAEDRAAIIRARQARRLPITEQLIARTWLLSKQKKTAKPVVADAGKDVPN